MSPNVNRLFELVEELADTPTLSAYLCTDGARRRGGTHGVWVLEVECFVRELRQRYSSVTTRANRDIFERNLRRLELRLRGLPQAMRARAWLVIVARGDVHYCAPVPFDGPSEGHWQRGPTFLFAPRVAYHS